MEYKSRDNNDRSQRRPASHGGNGNPKSNGGFRKDSRPSRRHNDDDERPRRYEDKDRKPRRFEGEDSRRPERPRRDKGKGEGGFKPHREKGGFRPRKEGGNEGNGFTPRRGKPSFAKGGERRGRFSDEKPAFSKRRGDDSNYESTNANQFDKYVNNKGKGYKKTDNAGDGLTRLNKYIANAGICSRREADELIAAGSITVNGQVVTEMGFKVGPDDVVAYGGETLRSERKRYFLLNKPKGFITTVDDPQERQTVMMLMDGACNERIYPVGRLDRATTGLLLFTNDGELAKRLTHPSTRVYKIYHVELDKPVTAEDIRQMKEGIELEDGMIQVDDVQYVEGMNDKRAVGIVLHSGRNRIVRRIFEHLGYNVHKLDRVVFAGLTKKDLPRGRYRELSAKEVGFLKMI